MRAVEYYAYIKSEKWKQRADRAKERVGHRCQVCNSGGLLDAHHRTYERLGFEHDLDITVLCRDCHKLFEFAKKEDTSQRSAVKRRKHSASSPVFVPPPPWMQSWNNAIRKERPTFWNLVFCQADWECEWCEEGRFFLLTGRFDSQFIAEQLIPQREWVSMIAMVKLNAKTVLRAVCGQAEIFRHECDVV